jgi:hypothetical protein
LFLAPVVFVALLAIRYQPAWQAPMAAITALVMIIWVTGRCRWRWWRSGARAGGAAAGVWPGRGPRSVVFRPDLFHHRVVHVAEAMFVQRRSAHCVLALSQSFIERSGA